MCAGLRKDPGPHRILRCVLMATHNAQLLVAAVLVRADPLASRLPERSRVRSARSLRLWHTTNFGSGSVAGIPCRVSVPACQRAPRQAGQTSGFAEEDFFSDITRGRPYHFGGRSSQSPQSLPHRWRPCQGAAAAGFVSCATRSRDASITPGFPGCRRSFQDPLEEPHHCITAESLCQVSRRPIRNWAPPHGHGFLRAGRERYSVLGSMSSTTGE
jgi:hypothetical protein